MKSDCSLDLFFTKNFFPFDLWIWISLIKSSCFPCPPTATLVFFVPMTSLLSCLVLCGGLTQFFFSYYSISNCFTTEILLPLQLFFHHLSWCLLCPQVPNSLSVCSRAQPRPCPTTSVTMAQAFIPSLCLLLINVSVPCRSKRSLMCTFPLVSQLLFTSYFSLWLPHSPPLLSLFPPFCLHPWNNLNHSIFFCCGLHPDAAMIWCF